MCFFKKLSWVAVIMAFVVVSCLYADSISVGEVELKRIVKQQEILFQDMKANESVEGTSDFERRLQDLVLAYELFITENPGNVYGYILYGKLLKSLDEEERAYLAFMRADQLDPSLAVVKQQLGNLLAETGEYAASLAYFLKAVELSPSTAVYHYQLGELLYTYKTAFIREKIFNTELLNQKMLCAFQQAATLAPQERDLKMRYAEAFYDVNNPNWAQALELWEDLFQSAPTSFDKELVRVHKARVLMELHRPLEAKQELNQVYSPSLEKERRELLDYLIDVSA